MNFSISDLAGEHTAITAMKTATGKWRYETELYSIERLQERRPNAPTGASSGFANWSRQRARWFKCSSLAKPRRSHELRTELYRRLSASPSLTLHGRVATNRMARLDCANGRDAGIFMCGARVQAARA